MRARFKCRHGEYTPVAAPAVSRAQFLTLFTGLCVLVALYFAARAGSWDAERRAVLGLGFLVVAGSVYLIDWYLHRHARAGRGRP